MFNKNISYLFKKVDKKYVVNVWKKLPSLKLILINFSPQNDKSGNEKSQKQFRSF